jgi:3-hydroxymyristoyl/3-hydroxydecanoyl-(acyl carrier protein) dehydratase
MNTSIPIYRLIPQRKPFIMVDRLLRVDGDNAFTRFVIGSDNYFVMNGVFSVTGLIEHIAQSASAMAGYKAIMAGVENPPVAMLASIKHFICYRQPCIGDILVTEVSKGVEVNGVTIVTGNTCIDNEKIAEISMKIYIPQ